MIRLIASDIDGTLIPYGGTALPERLFPLIERLHDEKGILFCPASGRQYHSLRRLFAPVADRIGFLCENGTVVFGPGAEDSAPVLSKTVIERGEALALAEAILAVPGCEVMISGANMVYVCGESPAFAHELREHLGNLVTPVSRPADVTEEIIKISAYCEAGAAVPERALRDAWGERFHVAVSGPPWLDLTPADKGTGLRGLCNALNIPLSAVMAFGDNWNDLAMLEKAGFPVLMESAPPELLARFPLHCADVCAVLEMLLER